MKVHLLVRERDRLATVLAAAMRTSAPVRDESALPAWEGTRSRGTLPTAAGSSARMCSTVLSGRAPRRWSSSYITDSVPHMDTPKRKIFYCHLGFDS